jgi:hypothetical protein
VHNGTQPNQLQQFPGLQLGQEYARLLENVGINQMDQLFQSMLGDGAVLQRLSFSQG